MLMLIVKAGDQVFALSSRDVIEIIPLIQIRPVPTSGDHLAGVIDYRGTLVPVIDLSLLLIGRACKRHLSSRIVLTSLAVDDHSSRLVGILAEGVTGTSDIDPESLTPLPAVFAVDDCLGGITNSEHGMTQEVRVKHILSERLRLALFGEGGLCKTWEDSSPPTSSSQAENGGGAA